MFRVFNENFGKLPVNVERFITTLKATEATSLLITKTDILHTSTYSGAFVLKIHSSFFSRCDFDLNISM